MPAPRRDGSLHPARGPAVTHQWWSSLNRVKWMAPTQREKPKPAFLVTLKDSASFLEQKMLAKAATGYLPPRTLHHL